MPLQDVSDDQTMISWLRQTGHAHLLDEQLHSGANKSYASPPPQNIPLGPTSSASNFSPLPPPPPPPPPNYPPQTAPIPSPSPIFSGGFNSNDPLLNSLNRSGSFPQSNFPPTSTFGGYNAGPLSSPTHHFIAPSFDHQSSPLQFNSSPTQFLAPNINQQQLDMDIENMKHDPNTRVVQRPPQEDVVYKQRVFVRYLQPPTPPVGGTIIVREKQPPGPPPDPPIVIKRAPPPPPTPPPVIIRERPPPMPPTEGTTVIDKIIPPGPKPPRQVVIEQYPPLPPKPQDVIIERWLPTAPRQRRILYERLPPSMQQNTRPIIVQYGPPHVRIQREIITAPGAHPPYQQIGGRTDINQTIGQIGGNQQIQSSFPSSSLGSYNPFTIQPNYSSFGQSQPNIVIMQGGQPNTITPSSYGTPLTCVCTPNQVAGLGAYGSGLSAVPTIGQSAGQSMVYNIPDNIPIDNILRQLGIDPLSIRPSGPQNAISHVWNAASHANPPPPIAPGAALSHVWNAASHANPPYSLPPGAAVSHVWNAAAHAADHDQTGSHSAGHIWDKIEQYLHPQSNIGAVQSAWGHIPHSNAPPPQSNIGAVQSAWSHIPHPNAPPPQSNVGAVQSAWSHIPHPNAPPHPNYPPSPSNYPPSPPNYPPPPSNYPPPPSNYPPPPPSNYPPPPPSNYPPPTGGPGSAGGSVLARLFGGGG